MTLWISDNALEDLNKKWYTPLLNDDCDPIGGELRIGLNGEYPCITNLFGNGSTIWLDSVEIDDDGDAICKVMGQDSTFVIYSTKETQKLKRRWERVE